MAVYSGPGFVIVRGVPVLQSDSVELDIKSGNSRVKTLLLGDAGHSPGAVGVSVTVSGGIPQSGLEIDWPALTVAQTEVPLGFKLAGKTYNCVGDISDCKMSSGVDKANVQSMTFNGRLVNIV